MGFISLGRRGTSPFVALEKLPHCFGLATTIKDFESLLAEVEDEVEKRISQSQSTAEETTHLAIFIDDYHVLSSRVDGVIVGRLEELIRRGQDAGITLFLSVPNLSLSGVTDGVLRRLKSLKCGIWMTSTDRALAQTVGLSIPLQLREKQLPPGRGFFYHPGGQVMLQVASFDNKEKDWVVQIVNRLGMGASGG
jgi:hypothetical protein